MTKIIETTVIFYSCQFLEIIVNVVGLIYVSQAIFGLMVEGVIALRVNKFTKKFL